MTPIFPDNLGYTMTVNQVTIFEQSWSWKWWCLLDLDKCLRIFFPNSHSNNMIILISTRQRYTSTGMLHPPCLPHTPPCPDPPDLMTRGNKQIRVCTCMKFYLFFIRWELDVLMFLCNQGSDVIKLFKAFVRNVGPCIWKCMCVLKYTEMLTKLNAGTTMTSIWKEKVRTFRTNLLFL